MLSTLCITGELLRLRHGRFFFTRWTTKSLDFRDTTYTSTASCCAQIPKTTAFNILVQS